MSAPSNPLEDPKDLYTQYPYGDLPEGEDPLQFSRPAINPYPQARPKQPAKTAELSGPRLKQYRRSPIVTILLPLAVIAVVVGLIYFGTRPDEVVDLTQTPSTPTHRATTPKSPGLPTTNTFSHNDLSGTFTITSAQWSGNQLVANVEVNVEEGSFEYMFRAMDKQSGDITECNDPTTATQVCTGELRAGEHMSGEVVFTKNHAATQIALADARTGTHLTIIMVPA